MVDVSPQFPTPEPADPENVVLALETARALWTKRDRQEAVRWLQRAAENSAEAGNDARAVALARAAADLTNEVAKNSEPPIPLDEAAALAPYDDFNEKTIVDSPATTLARHTLQSGVQITEARSTRTPSYRPEPDSTPLPGSARRASTERKARPRQAVRVAVQPSQDGGGSFVVTVLGEGAPAPPGTKLALLVALEPDSQLLE